MKEHFQFIEANKEVLDALEEANKIYKEKGITNRQEQTNIFYDILQRKEDMHKVKVIGNTEDIDRLRDNIIKLIDKKKDPDK